MSVTPTPVRSVGKAPGVQSASQWVGLFDHRADPNELVHCAISTSALSEIHRYFERFKPNAQKIRLEEMPLHVVVFRAPRINDEVHAQLVSQLDALLEAQPRSRIWVRMNEVKECGCDDTIRYLAEKSRALRAVKGEMTVSYTYDGVAKPMRELGLRDDFNLHLKPTDALSFLLINLDD